MSIKVMSEVWEHAPFVGTDLLILLALADMANDDRECWPGMKHVAHKGRITIQQATSVIKNLELQGVIEIVHRTVAGRGNISNLYRIKGVAQWDLLVQYDDSNPTNGQHTPLPKHSIPPSIIDEGETGKEPSLETKLETNTSRKREKVLKADTTPALQMNAMKDAIVAAFGWDSDKVTGREWGVIQKAAKELCTAGFEPDRVSSYHAWCKAKFTKGFSPAALASHLSEYRLARLDNPAQSTQPTEWADIPELAGITEIIR